MTRLVKLTIFASALALAGLGASPFAAADQLPRPCVENCTPGGGGGPPGAGNEQNNGGQGRRYPQGGPPQGQYNGPDQGGPPRHWRKPDNQQGYGDNGPDQGMPNRHARKYHPDDQYPGSNGNAWNNQQQTRHANRNWQYDPHRHERRRHKDSHFRFYFGGFWYPEPYWDEPYYSYDDSYDDYYDESYGVSCRQGAEIVSERFARVRILDCGGRVYTYLGRRYGETFEIVVSPRTGRILDAHVI